MAPLRAGSERPSLLESVAAARVAFAYWSVPYRRPLAVAKVLAAAALALGATVLALNVFVGDQQAADVMRGGDVAAAPKERATGAPELPAAPAAASPAAVIAELKPVVVEERRRFAAAETAEAQASAAAALASAYREAGGRVPDTALAGSLVATADAYSRLGEAVSAGDQVGYDRERAAVVEGEARTRAALDALGIAP